MELDLRQRISTRQQADSDKRLIELWLHGRSRHTQRAYRRDVDKFLSFTGKRVGEATLGDLQDFADNHRGVGAGVEVPGAFGSEVADDLWAPDRLLQSSQVALVTFLSRGNKLHESIVGD